MSTAHSPTAVDLFAGCGGSTLGLKWSGFEVLGAVEEDPLAAETYRENHPEVRLWERDVRSLAVSEVVEELGLSQTRLTLLAGCPPCQGFSRIRIRNSREPASDPRNLLIGDFCRFADKLRPSAILLENVPGLDAYVGLPATTSFLQDIGYCVQTARLDAAEFGVPQRRKRLILIGILGGLASFPEPSAATSTVREAIGSLPTPGSSGDPVHDAVMRNGRRVRSLISRVPKDGGSRLDLSQEDQLDCHVDFDGFKDVYGRMSWDDVAPTITGGCVNPSKGRFLHPEQDRAITPREASLLQSFPRTYYFSMRRGRYAVAEMIGNALPPALGASLGRHVRQILDGTMDCFTKEKRSEVMSSVRTRDTEPELQLRRVLWHKGLRYRKHLAVGDIRPDIVFTGQRLAIFVDGCFWHGCPDHYRSPETHREFWDKKVQGNRTRDLKQTKVLEEQGWSVRRYWECEIATAVDEVAADICQALSAGPAPEPGRV